MSITDDSNEEKKEVIWLGSMTKAPTPQKNPKSNVTKQNRHQKIWLHKDCGPT